ncbi:glycosyltransferase family 1 protein [Priestia megaterium]
MSEPVRVLQVFARMDRGGAETMIMNIYRKVDRKKVQFDFIVHTKDKCAYDDEIKRLGGKIYYIPRFSAKSVLAYQRAWNNFFKKHTGYKLIHGHVRSTASIYLYIAKRAGLTTIAHSHSTSSGSGFSSYIKNIMQYPIRYISNITFACSKQAGCWLFGDKATKKSNFRVINNAIDSEQYVFNQAVRDKVRSEFSLTNKFVIGHVGRFNYAKNHEFIVDIFKEIHNRNSDAVLMLIGDGELRPLIQKKVNDLGISNSVIFTGVRSDIPDLLQAMDLFLFPSLYEGLPVTLVEAQASGLKCIVSNTITDEVICTDNLVEFMSLKSNATNWAERALKYSIKDKRKDYQHEIIKAGYDINETSALLEEFYLTNGK